MYLVAMPLFSLTTPTSGEVFSDRVNYFEGEQTVRLIKNDVKVNYGQWQPSNCPPLRSDLHPRRLLFSKYHMTNIQSNLHKSPPPITAGWTVNSGGFPGQLTQPPVIRGVHAKLLISSNEESGVHGTPAGNPRLRITAR